MAAPLTVQIQVFSELDKSSEGIYVVRYPVNDGATLEDVLADASKAIIRSIIGDAAGEGLIDAAAVTGIAATQMLGAAARVARRHEEQLARARQEAGLD